MDNRAHTLVHLLLSICISSPKTHMAKGARTLAIFLAMFFSPPSPPMTQ